MNRGRQGKADILSLNPCIFLAVDKIMHLILENIKTLVLNIFTIFKRKV